MYCYPVEVALTFFLIRSNEVTDNIAVYRGSALPKKDFLIEGELIE